MKKRTLLKNATALLLVFVFLLTSCKQERPPEDDYDPFHRSAQTSQTDGGGNGGNGGTDDKIPEYTGSSKAIDIRPCEGIHITAKENAFWNDTDITFKPVDNSTKNINKIEQNLYDDGFLTFSAFEVEAGLKDDEFIPGQYDVEYDLTTLNIDPGMYEYLKVYRVGDDGQYYELHTKLDGNTLKFSCNQNSIVVVGSIALAIVASAAAGKEYYERNYYFIKKRKNVLRHDGKNKYGSYYIEWASDDVDPKYKEKLEQMRKIEDELAKEAEDYRKTTDIFGRVRSNYDVAEYLRKSIEADSEHKKLRDEIKLPELIKFTADCIDKSYAYLYEEEKMRMPIHTVPFKNVKDNKTDYGNASNRVLSNSYIEIRLHKVIEGESWERYNLLLTITHELLHICQNRYRLPFDKLTNMVRYDEMIAQVTEADALAYYKRKDYIPESADIALTSTDYWGNLSLPINGEGDKVLPGGEAENEFLINSGYNLGSFLRYLINKTGKRPRAHTMMKARSFWHTTNISDAVCGFMEIDEREFDLFFRNWVISNRKEIHKTAFSFSVYRSPGTPHQTIVNKGKKYHVNLLHTGKYFLTLRSFEMANGENQTMILVPDKELKDVFPSANIMPTGDYKKINAGAITSDFTSLKKNVKGIAIMEIQGDNKDNKSGDAGYTIYVLDKTPKVEASTKNDKVLIKLPEPELIAKDGVCDGYILKIVTDAGKKIEKDITKEMYGKTLEMNKSLLFDNETDTSVKITVTLNEFFTSTKDRILGIESDKVNLTVDRQTKETKQTKQSSETTKSGEESPLGDAKVIHSNDGKKANGYWKLKEINIMKGKVQNTTTGWKTSYSASAYSHTYTDSHAGNKSMKAQYAKFVATCSKLPDKIIPGDKVIVKLNLSMEDRATHLLSGHASMSVGLPSEERNSLKYNDGIRFFPTEKGAENTCYEDTCDNKHVPSVEVYYDFTQTGEKGSEIAILFYACSSNTVFIYEWVET